MRLVEESLLVFPCILVGGLVYQIYYVLVVHVRLCQKGDPFKHHHDIGSHLLSCSRECFPLFLFFDQSVKGFHGVVRPHHLHLILFWVDFFYLPVACEEMLDHFEC